jgi:hypothetical protein
VRNFLILALIGGALYWLLRGSTAPYAARRGQQAEFDIDPYDEEELLDEALRESFPASDSPAVSPHRRAGSTLP